MNLLLFLFIESIQWKSYDITKRSYYRKEWTVFDCQLENNFTNVSLWQKDIYGIEIERVADGKKIMKFANQKFNLTNLNYSDKGDYQCKACGETKIMGCINIDGMFENEKHFNLIELEFKLEFIITENDRYVCLCFHFGQISYEHAPIS